MAQRQASNQDRPSEQPSQPPQRHRRRRLVVLVVATVVVALIGVGTWRWASGGDGLDATTASGAPDGPSGGPEEITGISWTTAARTVVAAGPQVVVDEPEDDGGVVARDAATGRERWHHRGDALYLGGVSEAEQVAVVVAGGDDDTSALVGLNLASGEERWRSEAAGDLIDVAVVDDLVIALEDDYSLRAWHVADGEGAWLHEDRAIDCPRSWRHVGDVLVGVSHNCVGFPAALDWETGEVRWEVDADLWDEADDVPVLLSEPTGTVVDDVYLIWGLGRDGQGGGGDGDVVVALDAATGEQLWHRPALVDPPAVLDGRVVVVAGGDESVPQDRDEVQALDPHTGEVLWSFPIDVLPDAPAPLLASDGEHGYLLRASPHGGDTAVALTFNPDGVVTDIAELPACDQACDDGVMLDQAVLLTAGGHLLNAAGFLVGDQAAYSDGDPVVAIG